MRMGIKKKENCFMKFQFIFLLFLFANILLAQNQNRIINSGDYFFGSGTSFDVREARDRALEELTEQIAVRVAKSFERKIQESGNKLDDDVKSILRTHKFGHT